MKKLIFIALFLVLFVQPVEAKRRRLEDFFNHIEKPPTNAPAPSASPTAPPPTPKPAVMYPNDTEVRTFLNESTDHIISSTPESSPSTGLKMPVKPQPESPPDQTPSMIASFLTFMAVAAASYHGFFNRGFFRKL